MHLMAFLSIASLHLICGWVYMITNSVNAASGPITVEYNKKTFWLSDATGDNSQARTACLNAGGSLALFSTNSEYVSVLRYLYQSASAEGMKVQGVWIDILDMSEPSNPVANVGWEREKINSSFWRLGQPVGSCLLTSSDCCMQILRLEKEYESLDDPKCGTVSAYLCESSDPCVESNCQQLCVNSSQGGYSCHCERGYTLDSDGTSCQDVDECLSTPCEQTCRNTVGSYLCGCRNSSGQTSRNHGCTTTTGCAKEQSVCEQKCVDTGDSFYCSCHEGYTIGSNNRSCIDVDECKVLKLCKQICVNYGGGFHCECFTGYTLNTTNCEDIDECENPNACEHACRNTPGSYKCTCDPGYTLDGNNRSCNDINECEINRTTCSQVCTNTNGSFQCSCLPGFTLATDSRSCSQADEPCSTLLPQCQQTCTKSQLGIFCSCYSGYALAADNVTCADINECLTDASECQHLCINQPGGYQCACRDGYHMGADNRSCILTNSDSTSDWKCLQKSLIVNGSVSCACVDGYTLNTDGMPCSVQDTCNTTHVCHQLCTNTNGSYKCDCHEGFHLAPDGASCEDIDECSNSTFPPCSGQCVNTNGSYTCACAEGYTLDQNNTCLDVDECLHSTVCEHACINTDGSFTCSCRPGYFLTTNNSCAVGITNTSEPHQCPCHVRIYHNTSNLNNDLTVTDDLLIHKRKTSMFRRAAISAPDDRISAKAIGTSGALILCLICGVILLSDISHLTCLFCTSRDVSQSSDND